MSISEQLTETVIDEPVKQYINPLPYVIAFAVLSIILMVVVSWFITLDYSLKQCILEPNFWCSNQWTCETKCPQGSGKNACFTDAPSGLADCLFGPNSKVSNLCEWTENTGSLLCDCDVTNANNCFNNCPLAISQTSVCCCEPGKSGCTATCPG